MDAYQRAHVTVDDHFARFGSKSYAINKITSVDVKTDEKRSSAWLFVGIFGSLFLVSAFGMLGKGDSGTPVTALIGVAMIALATFLYPKRISRSYVLMLATAAGEVQATTSTDGNAITELREVIEGRIASHGLVH